VGDANEDERYGAMGWLLARQSRIEKKLAARHLGEGGQVIYDVNSSYYEGHSRDGKRGKPIVLYGELTDPRGCPLAVDVYSGNTADPTTVPNRWKSSGSTSALCVWLLWVTGACSPRPRSTL